MMSTLKKKGWCITLKPSSRFEKDFVKCAKRKLNIDLLSEVVEILEGSGKLPRNYKHHICFQVIIKDIGSATFKPTGC